MDKHLRALCKTAMGQEKTAMKSMTLVTDIYKKNRQVLVKRHCMYSMQSTYGENTQIKGTNTNQNYM